LATLCVQGWEDVREGRGGAGGPPRVDTPSSPPPQVDRYQEAPHLLDACLPTLIPLLANAMKAAAASGDAARSAALASLAWRAARVRGRKAATKFFPATVDDFEPVVLMLAGATGVADGLAEGGEAAALVAAGTSWAADPRTWPARAVLLVWLAAVAAIPFPLALLDGRPAGGGNAAFPPLARAAAAAATACLPSPGPDRDAAAAALAVLVARPDAVHMLGGVVEGAAQALADASGAPLAALGAATLLAALFGRADPVTASTSAPAAWDAIAPLLAPASAHGVSARRAAAKGATRVALALLAAPRADADKARTQAAAAALLGCLRDRDTAVRWAAAKGVARVGAALVGRGGGADAAAALLTGALDLLVSSESDSAWHGGCLAVAGLLRAGCVDAAHLGRCGAAAAAALAYDVRRGATSVGAPVRDAGAYVAWALARRAPAAPAAAGAALAALAPRLMATACLDREVNCRRAAAAAFQEAAGRTRGALPAGLPATAAADFYSLATRASAYLSVAPVVAELHDVYASALVEEALVKTAHWERATRDAAAASLAALCGVAPALTPATADALVAAAVPSSDPEARHGALAGLACLVAAARPVGRAAAAALASLPAAAPALVKGRGGEPVRHALMNCIAAMAAAGQERVPLDRAALAAAGAAVDDCLRHPAAPVRAAAAAALGALARRDDGGGTPVDAASRYVSWVAAPAPPEPRRGGAAALEALPARWLAPHADTVLATLSSACIPESDPEARDAEARAEAAAALAACAAALASASDSPPTRSRLRSTALPALIGACADYSTDRRGDVGSWVRGPASAGAASTLLAAAADSDGATLDAFAEAVVAALVRQASERCGKLRAAAAAELRALVAARVPAATPLAPALDASAAASAGAPASDDAASLDLARRLLAVPGVAPRAAAGLAACVGGLDGPLALAASRALATAVEEEGAAAAVFGAVVEAWRAALAPPRDARIITPLLRAADALLATPAGADWATDDAASTTLLDLVQASARGSRDVPRLRAAACALAGLAGGAGPPALRALRAAVLLTGHSFPAVRRAAAEAVAVRLVLGAPAVGVAGRAAWPGFEPATPPDVDAAANLVNETVWDGAGAAGARLALCGLLALPPPEAGPKRASAPAAGDGGATTDYGALIAAAERGG